MDRAYLDFERLHATHTVGAFLITRTKSNTDLRRPYSTPTDRPAGLICDQATALDRYRSRRDYPAHLHRIKLKDPDTGNTVVFLTNDFALPGITVCNLYKERWNIGVFFRWLKQHLRIKQFYGVSENVAKTRLWIAVATCLLMAIVKKRLGLDHSPHPLLYRLDIQDHPIPRSGTGLACPFSTWLLRGVRSIGTATQRTPRPAT